MPSDLDLTRQLRAFGETLTREAGSSLAPAGPAATAPEAAVRRWMLLTAAACVVALILGLAVVAGRGADDREAPAAATTVPATTVPVTAPPTTVPATTVPPTTAPATTVPPTTAPSAPDLSSEVGDDPLGLLAGGWTRSSRTEEPFADSYEGCDDPSLAAVAGIESVREFLSYPISGTTVVATYLPESAGADIRAATSALGACSSLVGSDDVTSLDDPASGVSGFRTDAFALVAVSVDGLTDIEHRPVTVVLSVLPAIDVGFIAALVDRAVSFIRFEELPPLPAAAPATPLVADEAAGWSTPSVEAVPPGDPIPTIADTDEVVVLMVADGREAGEPVRLMVEIDGVEVVDVEIAPGGSDGPRSYLVRGLLPGPHDVFVVSGGAGSSARITTVAGAPRWVAVTYRYEPAVGRALGEVFDSDTAFTSG